MNSKYLWVAIVAATTCQLSLAQTTRAPFVPAESYLPTTFWSPARKIEDGSASARLNQLTSFLADQLTHNRDLKNVSDSRIAIATFANMPSLVESDKIGLAIEERMTHEMQTRGFRIVDYKLTGSLKITERGDFVYSRHVADLRRDYNINYFLAGVIENSVDGFVIHARLVDAASNIVVSSGQAFLGSRDASRLLRDFQISDQPKIIIEKYVPAKVGENRVRLN
jgi:TolB-like protein